MRRKKSEEPSAPARADGRVSPADIQQVEFRLAFRGYNERDVDAFLDRLTEDLSWYLEENQRLGAGAGAASPDAGADPGAIVSKAREEAAEIVRRAEEEAVAIRAAAGGGSGDARAAVAPFLNREREFLQSLGSLVQNHAEDVKAMVLAIRARSGPAPGTASQAPGETDAGAPPDVVEAEVAGAASAAEIRERLGGSEPSADVRDPESSEASDRVIVDSATEPAYSSEGAPAAEGRERSLRELFWGDE
jgi:DivIVA domain-containing protein